MTDFRFILIDDDQVSNMISKLTIEKVLGKIDIQVFTNAETALKYIESEYSKPVLKKTILLLDINMPIMSGWEFLEQFEKLSTDIRNCIHIYMLTSSLDGRDRDRSLSLEYIKDHLVKPLTTEVVHAQILERT